MNRVLLTGATGFIGRGTLAPLLKRGATVHAVTSRQPPPQAPPEVHWERMDLHAEGAVEGLIERVAPTELLHLAWYAEPGRFWHSPENLRWVQTSLRLVRAFAESGGQRAVLAGSCAEYEWASRTTCDERATPCRPATLYGTCKHALRLVAERYCEDAGVSLAWGRVFFVFGPHEHPARLGGSVGRALAAGDSVDTSHGEQVRDFLYSEDLADAFVTLLDSAVSGPVNLASGTPVRIREFVLALAEAAGRPELIHLGARAAPASEPDELIANVQRLRDEVGWTPPASLSDRAADTVAWWRANHAEQRRGPQR